MADRKKRIAVLHGTAGNGQIVKFQLAQLVRKLDDFDVTYVDAPKVVEKDNRHAAMMRKIFGDKQILREFAVASVDQRGWRIYEDIDNALKAAEELVGQVDAIVAFSQGANFATMLVARAEQRGQQLPAVLMCGAKPGWVAQLPGLFEKKLESPAFIVGWQCLPQPF